MAQTIGEILSYLLGVQLVSSLSVSTHHRMFEQSASRSSKLLDHSKLFNVMFTIILPFSLFSSLSFLMSSQCVVSKKRRKVTLHEKSQHGEREEERGVGRHKAEAETDKETLEKMKMKKNGRTCASEKKREAQSGKADGWRN
ncbi:unnamed protein product [Leuciscus chuanchicus]